MKHLVILYTNISFSLLCTYSPQYYITILCRLFSSSIFTCIISQLIRQNVYPLCYINTSFPEILILPSMHIDIASGNNVNYKLHLHYRNRTSYSRIFFLYRYTFMPLMINIFIHQYFWHHHSPDEQHS